LGALALFGGFELATTFVGSLAWFAALVGIGALGPAQSASDGPSTARAIAPRRDDPVRWRI
jgi:hypothetical protein